MANLSVFFGAVPALRSISLDIFGGEIVGLVGHNGAGKSTLVNVVSGSTPASGGTVSIDGEIAETSLSPGRTQLRRVVRVIHQEPALVGNLSVADNLTLCTAEQGAPRTQRRRAAADALNKLDLNIRISVERPVETLSLGQRQLVDIAKAIRGDVRILLLDEPTGALSEADAVRLHELLRDLATRDTAIVYVSHRLRDILDVCTRVVVLREGAIVADRPAEVFTSDSLSTALAPALQQARDRHHRRASGPTLLEVTWPDNHLIVHHGEAVGLFGMAGGPQYQLLEQLFGVGAALEAVLGGRVYRPTSPTAAIKAGVGYVPSEREREALLPRISAFQNMMLPNLRRFGRGSIDFGCAWKNYRSQRHALKISGPPGEAPVDIFSGGNRQKHVVSRWLLRDDMRLLLLGQPLQGVDVGARADIVNTIRLATDRGLAVIVASCESDEIATLTDRALVVTSRKWTPVSRTNQYESSLMEALLHD